ncbi:MAG: symmetrical bis(5'-nucleosyl)-tetraphosphatase, partial [Pseudomonadales bacterium]
MTKRTFAVGDIQGCYDSLRCVLDGVAFDAAQDQLWVVGDLVNRGPQSLATLRYLKDLGKQCKIVLGNHDLHLLAVASGAQKIRKNDTFADVLDAPDRDALLAWLRRQPLIYSDEKLGFTMVHAGIPPRWTLDRALQLAAEVEKSLQGKKASDFFANMYGDGPKCWDDKLGGNKRLRCIVNYLTRMRFCTAEGKLDLKDKGSTESKRP